VQSICSHVVMMLFLFLSVLFSSFLLYNLFLYSNYTYLKFNLGLFLFAQKSVVDVSYWLNLIT